jgi:hypothetical protein
MLLLLLLLPPPLLSHTLIYWSIAPASTNSQCPETSAAGYFLVSRYM